MLARARENNLHKIDKNLLNYAYGQNQDGIVDISIDKEYKVYGIRENDLGTFYLILTDEVNKDLPWWLPGEFFDTMDLTYPEDWTKEVFDGEGEDTIIASKAYHDAMIDIEDGTDKGREAFKQMQY